MTTVADVIQSEGSKYGLPPWLVVPLIYAESGNDPNAENAGHYGLLQISPDFPGAQGLTPQQLENPVTNLDIGFAQLAKTYNAEGRPGDSLQAYEDTISHSGWATNAGWQAEPSDYQQNYIRAYNLYHSGGIAAPTQQVPDVQLAGWGPGGVLPNWLNPFNPATPWNPNPDPKYSGGWGDPNNVPFVGGTIRSVDDFFSALGDLFSLILDHPGYLIVGLVALAVMWGAGRHIFDEAPA